MQPFNKYYPPDWDPSKGSVNKFVGSHPLGDRARKIDQGILIVRFELPFNIWCEGCENHIGKGVRYNAEKKKAGNYYSTPIWSFRMKCHLCDNWFEIQTDPKNAEYVVVSGARRKEEEWDPEDTGTIKLKDDDEARKLAEDAFYKLEHAVKDEQKHAAAVPVLTQLQRLNERQWADPYTLSQKMRKIFRNEKKVREAQNRQDEEILDRNGLSIALLPESHDDVIRAKTTQFSDPLLEQAQKRKLEVTASSIFESSSSRKESKKTKVSALAAKDKVAQLSAMAKVNTKLKIDPFLRNDSVVSKPDNVRSMLGIVKRKNTSNYAEASGSSESGNVVNEVDGPVNEEVLNNSSHSQRERTTDVHIHPISLVSTDYDNDGSEESEETEEG